jgi:hypothetical protein
MTARRKTGTAIAIIFEFSSVSLFSNFTVGEFIIFGEIVSVDEVAIFDEVVISDEVVIVDEVVIILITIIDTFRKDDEVNMTTWSQFQLKIES